jgi:hypothetical protein
MIELNIAVWIQEISHAIQEAETLIQPLKHLGKREWAAQLTDEVKMMREAIESLQRIGQNQGKRAGRPPKWLQSTPHDLRPAKRKRPEN